MGKSPYSGIAVMIFGVISENMSKKTQIFFVFFKYFILNIVLKYNFFFYNFPFISSLKIKK